MPNKSKRNRRNISPKREFTGSAVSKIETNVQATASSPEKPGTGYRTTYKTPTTTPATEAYFLNEIKWISLVAGTIIVLLLIAYFIFR